MICMKCGGELRANAVYCLHCGTMLSQQAAGASESVLYQLEHTAQRQYDLRVYPNRLTIDGKFWYLKDKEFVAGNGADTAYLHNFIGMGYLNKRSYRKILAFVCGGTVLGLLNLLFAKLSDLAYKANSLLQWIGESATLPAWMAYLLNGVMIICIILGILMFFSKKKVVEISFTDKRICIPQRSISNAEYVGLYQTIKNLSKTGIHKT